MSTTQTTETDTYQDIQEEPLERISLTLMSDGKAEVLIENMREDKSHVDYALTHLSKDEMWEHIHNCLTIMEGMK